MEKKKWVKHFIGLTGFNFSFNSWNSRVNQRNVEKRDNALLDLKIETWWNLGLNPLECLAVISVWTLSSPELVSAGAVLQGWSLVPNQLGLSGYKTVHGEISSVFLSSHPLHHYATFSQITAVNRCSARRHQPAHIFPMI